MTCDLKFTQITLSRYFLSNYGNFRVNEKITSIPLRNVKANTTQRPKRLELIPVSVA